MRARWMSDAYTRPRDHRSMLGLAFGACLCARTALALCLAGTSWARVHCSPDAAFDPLLRVPFMFDERSVLVLWCAHARSLIVRVAAPCSNTRLRDARSTIARCSCDARATHALRNSRSTHGVALDG